MDILIKIMIGCFVFSAFMFLVYGLLKLFKLDDKIIETEQQRKDRETRQFIEECVEEFPEDFSPEDYIDAFNWIVISLTCDKCNEKKELVNLELS